MSVSITFEPAGVTGLVAEGTYLIDAARRMGVAVGAGCSGGAECPGCQVTIKIGSTLLSVPTDAEKDALGTELLAQAHRLACQVRIERRGELVVNVSSSKEGATVENSEQSDLRKKFSELSLAKKIALLAQLETLTMSEAFDAALEKPLAFGAKVLDTIAERAKSARAQERDKNRPPEHH
jgi:uncharacterized 2Fe-2S/4Fe-4S cluster protein (DUF4445 family)